jgi:hypothetical protein
VNRSGPPCAWTRPRKGRRWFLYVSRATAREMGAKECSEEGLSSVGLMEGYLGV